MIKFSSIAIVSKTTQNTNVNLAYVSDKVQALVASKGRGAAQITIAGPGVRDTFRGTMQVVVGEERFEIVQGDTHALWASHQPLLASFGRLWDLIGSQGKKGSRKGKNITATVCTFVYPAE